MPAPPATQASARGFRFPQLIRWLAPLAALIILAAVGYILHGELAKLRLAGILAHLHAIPRSHMIAAFALTALSYCIVSGYDLLALRYIRKRLLYPRVMFTAFIATAFGHNLGFSAFTGGAIRLRLYTAAGITAVEVATITVFYSVSIALGLTAITGISLASAPVTVATALHLRPAFMTSAGVLLLALVLGYLLWASLSRHAIEIRGWALRAPGVGLGAGQILLSVIDLSVAGSVLWALLPPGAHIGLVPFMGAYAIALSAGILSHVPGGIGVFETVILLTLRAAPVDSILGALLAFRALYYLAPLLVGAALFAYQEFHARRSNLAQAHARAKAYVTPAAPQIAGSLVFFAGALLIISAILPPPDVRVPLLHTVLPQAVFTIGALAASVLGTVLLLLSRPLFRRVRSAYQLAVRVLAAAMVAALAQGLLIEEIPLLALVLTVLALGQRAFYRPIAIAEERFTPVWIAGICGVLLLAVWVGLLSYHSGRYTGALWWASGTHHGAGFMVRGALLPALLVIGYLTVNLLQPVPAEPAATSEDDLARARRLIERGGQSLANAALSGDKRLLFAEAGEAFLAYQIAGHSWVTLGDPLGEQAGVEELLWRFCQMADRHGGQPVFYQTGARWLPQYEDLGLAPLPIGAQARVPLERFSLSGPDRAVLRQIAGRARHAALTFEVRMPPVSRALLAQLRSVSDAWLAGHATGERRFSVGFFSPRYLRQFPIAFVQRAGEPLAFADLWPAGNHREVAFDLIRFSPRAPIGTMSYLLVETLLWARERGYHWANLGMAPIAGLERDALAPAWHRAGQLLFPHGEHFDHLEQMRHYFERFKPRWETRYLLAPGGIALPRVLIEVARLIGGGAPQRKVR